MAKKYDSYVKFIGGNSYDVTGSCNLVKFMGYAILLDCGGVQTNDDDYDYKENIKLHKDIKPKQLTAIILSHQNIDHHLKIPLLYQKGCSCPLYIAKGSKSIFQIMWQDSVKIFNQDYENFKRVPIYSQDDVDKTMSYIVEVDLHDTCTINEYISFKFYRAEHIPKARQIVLELNDGNTVKRVGYTGDISHKYQQYYVDEFEPIQEYLNVAIGECTYAKDTRAFKKNDRHKDIEKLKMAINYAITHKSKVLIPTFANCRLQEILTTIYDIYDGKPPIKIIIHTPLGETICKLWNTVNDKNKELWNDIMNWDKKIFINDFKDVKYFSEQKEFPLLILASGGFLKQGSALAWLKQILPNPNDYIVFCGYSSTESNASKIKSGKIKEIKIDRTVLKNKCKFIVLNSYSSHMDKEQLLNYYTNDLQYNKLCLVHCEPEPKIKFAEELRKRLSTANRTSKVIATNYETKINF